MVILRLQRIGKKKEPHFRLIAQEKSKDPHDRSLEILGWLNPRTKEKQIKKERIEYWLSVGAQCTNTVHNLLIDEEIIKGDKRKAFKISKKRLAKEKGRKGEESRIKNQESSKEKSEEAKEEKPAPEISQVERKGEDNKK